MEILLLSRTCIHFVNGGTLSSLYMHIKRMSEFEETSEKVSDTNAFWDPTGRSKEIRRQVVNGYFHRMSGTV